MKLLVTGLVLAFVVCSAEAAVDEPFLLMAASNPRTGGGNIIRMHPKTLDYYEISMSETLLWPIAIDFDPEEERIYWSEGILWYGRIRRSFLDGTNVETVYNATKADSSIDGLAVDAKNKLLFYTDFTINIVGKLTLPGFTQETIIDSDLNNPRAIALNTKDRLVYWTDYGKIERANYDGTGRKVIISGLRTVTGLALDVPNKRMYWVDAFTDRVERSDLEGHGRKLIRQLHSTYTFIGLAEYDDILYITDWNQHGSDTNDSQVLYLDQDGDGFVIHVFDDLRLNDIHAYSGSYTLARNGWTTTALFAFLIIVVIG